MDVDPFPSQRTVQQIAEKEEKGNECRQRISQFIGMRKERYFQRPLELTVDGRQETHNEIDESQDRERS